MSLWVIFTCVVVGSFFVGWSLGTVSANDRAWRESVDRSRGYQDLIDQLRSDKATPK